MDWLRWFFLESFVALAATLFLVNFALLVYWRRTGKPRPLLIGLAVAVILLVLQAAVVTRRERAAMILDRIQLDILASTADALDQFLAATFVAESMDKATFVAYVRRWQAEVRVCELHRTALQITAYADGSFTAEAAYLADLDVGRTYRSWLPTRWEIRFIREQDEWRIGAIAPLEINHQPARHFAEIERFRP